MMKTKKQLLARISIIAVFSIVLWYLLLLIMPDNGNHHMTKAKLTILAVDLQRLSGKPMTQAKLDSQISLLDMNVHANHYHPEINFNSESNWTVRLVPEKEFTYTYSKSFLKRIAFLSFEKMKYPVLECGCPQTD